MSATPMRLEIEAKSAYYLVRLHGTLRAADGAALEEDVHPLIAPRGTKMIVDLSALESIDSSGLSQLIGLTTHARLSESRVVMIRPAPFIAGIFEVTRLDNWFELVDDLAEAERRLGTG